MKKDNIFWGLLLVLGGIFLIVSKLGFLGEINAFSIVSAIFLVGIIIRNVIDFHISGILFPIAFIAILFDDQLGITAITPWTVLVAALLGTIGFNLIFGKKHWYNHCHSHKSKVNYGEYKDYNVQKINTPDDGNVRIDTTFGGFIKYINTNCLEQTDIDCSFASLKVYFDGSKMKSDNAVINLDVSFAGVQLYIPKEWRVINKADVSFAAVEEKNNYGSVITNTITLVGDVSFGGVDIYYV